MTTLSGALSYKQKYSPTLIASTISLQSRDKMQPKQLKIPCVDCHLCHVCLSKTLDALGLEKLNRVIRKLGPFRKGQHLFQEGDEFRSLYFIRSGAVKSYSATANGNELGVSFYLPGETIGLDGLYTKRHASSVVALEDTFVCEFPFHALENLLATQPLMQKHFNELLSRQLVQNQAMILLHSQKTADEQLAAFLINLSQRYKRLKLSSLSFRLPMTRRDIALCLGLAYETVSRLFSNFQQRSWMSVEGREITLMNMPNVYIGSLEQS